MLVRRALSSLLLTWALSICCNIVFPQFVKRVGNTPFSTQSISGSAETFIHSPSYVVGVKEIETNSDTFPSKKEVIDTPKKVELSVAGLIKNGIAKSEQVKKNLPILQKDTLKKDADSAKIPLPTILKSIHRGIVTKAENFKNISPIKKGFEINLKDSTLFNKKELENIKSRPILRFEGGIVNYNFSYRSNLDTPFAEKNLLQHTGYGSFDFAIANKFPIRVTYLIRNGNSSYFKDIHDVRVDFDVIAYRNRLSSNFKDNLAARINDFRDSLTERLYHQKITELKNLKQWFEDPFTYQRLYEMNEIARVPSISYDRTLPDSVAQKQSDSIQALAKLFLDQYTAKKTYYDNLILKIDSLKNMYEESRSRINELKNFARGNYGGWRSFRSWKNKIHDISRGQLRIPKKYEWLLGIRSFSLGKTFLNHSELTTKNISLNGVNFEYNSWYYFAVSAGLIDYRFRDFSFKPFKSNPQYLYILRLGIGELERNYVILSGFRGQKQLYTSDGTSKGIRPVSVTGLSIEGKYQFARNSFIIAEAAQSITPNLDVNSTEDRKFWNFSDYSNKAVSFKLYSFLPKTRSRIEGSYKYTGANFQSFNSFQTNAAFTSWHIKVDQNLFRRSLKIVVALKSNEFANPYIIQNYKSTNIFKSILVSYRKKNLPTITFGYIPVSQFMRIENALLESRFQTLTASFNHLYKLGSKQTATSIVFNRFYNSSADSGFVYFNAINVVIGQTFFLQSFNASLNLIETRNPNYRLNVLDGSIQIPLSQLGGFSLGAKINTLNKDQVKVGYYGNVQMRFNKKDIGFISFEKGYLTGINNRLSNNDFLNIGISKYFK